MNNIPFPIPKFHLRHQTHLETLLKFALLLLILVGYFGYLAWRYDVATGGFVAALTWSFFVLCTPVADAGFLLDFPLRLLFGWRMITTEVAVWLLAALINIVAVVAAPAIYETTFITSLFHKILVTPYPYWGIIVLCSVGTFVSIYFGDEMMDVVSHHERTKRHAHGFKYRVGALGVIFLVVFVAYRHLIAELGVEDIF